MSYHDVVMVTKEYKASCRNCGWTAVFDTGDVPDAERRIQAAAVEHVESEYEYHHVQIEESTWVRR